MDLPIRAPRATCAVTGRPFAPGEPFHSALVRGEGGLARVDVGVDAWSGPPSGTVAAWRSTYPDAGATGPVLAPIDVLLDALEELSDDPAESAVRYLLALHLVRRRVLRLIDGGRSKADDVLILTCRRREREYRVPPADVRAAGSDVAGRLAALLWSGEAA